MKPCLALDQTCTRLIERQVPDDYGDLVIAIRTCGSLVPPGQMFCDRCEDEIREHRAAELESEGWSVPVFSTGES